MKIFISYRRADDPTFVQLLFTHFSYLYGPDNVFMDFASIPHFSRFEDFIRSKVAEADVVMVIIGARWLEHIQERESRGEKDYVRIEIQEALRLNKPIAPICIPGGRIPDAKTVPADLRSLFDLDIPTINDGRDLDLKFPKIRAAVERLLTGSGPESASVSSVSTPPPVSAPAGESIDSILQRFNAAQKAARHEEALLLLEMLRERNLPEFFGLDERIAAVQATITAAAEARQRRQAADYLYGVLRSMVAIGDPPERLLAGLREVWKVEKGYDPDNIDEYLQVFIPTLQPHTAEKRREIVVRSLQPLYPIDWVRLYVWIFFWPKRWVKFRETDPSYIRTIRTGAWLSGTLAVLPLLILQSGVVAGRQVWPDSSLSTVLLTALIGIIWIANILISYTANWLWRGLILGVAFGMAVLMGLPIASGVTSGVGGIVALGVSVAVADRLNSASPTPAMWQVALGLAAPIAYAVLIAQFWFGVPLP